MIKRSIVLSISEPLDEKEIAVSVRSTTDGSNNVIMESISTKYSVNPEELTQALQEARSFMLTQALQEARSFMDVTITNKNESQQTLPITSFVVEHSDEGLI